MVLTDNFKKYNAKHNPKISILKPGAHKMLIFGLCFVLYFVVLYTVNLSLQFSLVEMIPGKIDYHAIRTKKCQLLINAAYPQANCLKLGDKDAHIVNFSRIYLYFIIS